MANLSNTLLTGGTPSAPNVAASNPMGGFRAPPVSTNIGEALNKGLKDVRDMSFGYFKAKQQKIEMKAINLSDKVVQKAWLAAQQANTDDMQDVFKAELDKGFAQLAKDTGIESNSVILENVRIEFDAKVNRQQVKVDASQMKRTSDELIAGYNGSIDEALNDWNANEIDKAELDIRLERTYVMMRDGIGTAFHSEAEVKAAVEKTRKYVLGRMETIRGNHRNLAIDEIKAEAGMIREQLTNKEITAQQAITAFDALRVKTLADGRFETQEEALAAFYGYGPADWGIRANLEAKAHEETRIGLLNKITIINNDEKEGVISRDQATANREAVHKEMIENNDAWDSDEELEHDWLKASKPLSFRDRGAEVRAQNMATLVQGIRGIESDSTKTLEQKRAALKTLATTDAAIASFISKEELSNYIDGRLHGIIVGSVNAQLAIATEASAARDPDWRKNTEEALDEARAIIETNKENLTDAESATLISALSSKRAMLKERVTKETIAHINKMATDSNAGTAGELVALGEEVRKYLAENAYDAPSGWVEAQVQDIVRTRTEMLLLSIGGNSEADVRENAGKLLKIYIDSDGTPVGFESLVENRISKLKRDGVVALDAAKKTLREDDELYNATDEESVLRVVTDRAQKLFDDEGYILPQVLRGGDSSTLGEMKDVNEVINELIRENIVYAHDNLTIEKNVDMAEKLLKVYHRDGGMTDPVINKLIGDIEGARDSLTVAQRQADFQFAILLTDGTADLAQLSGRALEKLNTLIENTGDVSLHIKYANNSGVITSGLKSRYNSLMSKEQADYAGAFALLEGLKPYQARQLAGLTRGILPGTSAPERLSWMYLNMGADQKTTFIKSLDIPGHVQGYTEAFADVWLAMSSGGLYTGGQEATTVQMDAWDASTLAFRKILSTTGGAFDTNQTLLFLQPAVMFAANDLMNTGGIVSTPEQRISRLDKLSASMAEIVDEEYVNLVTEGHEDEMYSGNLMPKSTLKEFYGAGEDVLWEKGGALYQENVGINIGFAFDTETMVFTDLENLEGTKDEGYPEDWSQGNKGRYNQVKNILAQRTFILDMPGIGNLLVIPVFETLNTVTPTGFLIYEKDGAPGSPGMRSYNGMENAYFDVVKVTSTDPTDTQNAEAWFAALLQYDNTYSNKNGALEAYTAPPVPGTPISWAQAQGKYRIAVSDVHSTSNEVEYAAQIMLKARLDGWGIPTTFYPVDWDDSKIKAIHDRYKELLNTGP